MKYINHIIAPAALAGVLVLGSCSTLKTITDVVKTDTVKTVQMVPQKVSAVVANPEFITIQEAVSAVVTPETLADVAKKYGYKTIVGYGIYRLDSYDKMLYRNCTPAKAVGKGIYADTPKPMRRGTSSYVAVNQSLTIGVFNAAAYDNLVNQVKAGGFRLVETGYEDHYTNGTVDVYCYAARKTVRLEKGGM